MVGLSQGDWKTELHDRARAEGFAAVRIAPAQLEEDIRARYRAWLASGFHGEMAYMARASELRLDPTRLLPGARSVLVFRADYFPYESSRRASPPSDHSTVRVAKYALGMDYHVVLRHRLSPIVEWLASRFPGHEWRIAIDSAPVLERAYAVASGVGFWAKNTMVIAPGAGSYFFLATVLTTAALEPDPPVTGTCGRCRRCLDACPTGAIVAPYWLDARRCLSYLTIEKKSPSNDSERALLGEWIFGCDVCQDVCPYNKRPPFSPFQEFRAGTVVEEFVKPEVFLEPESNRAFARRFHGSPLLRAGKRRLQAVARWFLQQRLAASSR